LYYEGRAGEKVDLVDDAGQVEQQLENKGKACVKQLTYTLQDNQCYRLDVKNATQRTLKASPTLVNQIPKIKDYRVSQKILFKGQLDHSVRSTIIKGLLVKVVTKQGNKTDLRQLADSKITIS
jgi:hypothetical protein